jgi:hypothetical protein
MPYVGPWAELCVRTPAFNTKHEVHACDAVKACKWPTRASRGIAAQHTWCAAARLCSALTHRGCLGVLCRTSARCSTCRQARADRCLDTNWTISHFVCALEGKGGRHAGQTDG